MDNANKNEVQDIFSTFVPMVTNIIGNTTSRLAVLIDADNISPQKIDDILNEIKKYGEIILKRAYGDFTLGNKKEWKKICNKYAINMIQISQYIKGKNTTDITLAIDAMKMLLSNIHNSFCLVSSDSDFTPLAIALKEYGKKVYIVGDEKTSESLREAGTNFICIKELANAQSAAEEKKHELPKELLSILPNFFRNAKDGWLSSASLGSKLKNEGFDYKNLNEFLESHNDIFECDMRTNGKDEKNSQNMYVRLKKSE